MRKHALPLIVSTALFLSASGSGLVGSAQTSLPQGKQPETLPSRSRLILSVPKNPYDRLFQPRASELRQLEAAHQPEKNEPSPAPTLPPGSHEPRIDCKIRVLLADPSIDRGIRVPKPSVDTKLAMRMLEHPCLKQ